MHLKIGVDGHEMATFFVSGDGQQWRQVPGEIYFGDSWHDLRDGRGGQPDLGWVGLKKRNVWTATTMGVFAVGGESTTCPPADFDNFQVLEPKE